MEENGRCEVVRSVERTEDLFAQKENAFLSVTTFRSVRRRTRLIGAKQGLQLGTSLPLICIFINRFFLVRFQAVVCEAASERIPHKAMGLFLTSA